MGNEQAQLVSWRLSPRSLIFLIFNPNMISFPMILVPALMSISQSTPRRNWHTSIKSHVRSCSHELLLLVIWNCTCNPRFVYLKYRIVHPRIMSDIFNWVNLLVYHMKLIFCFSNICIPLTFSSPDMCKTLRLAELVIFKFFL